MTRLLLGGLLVALVAAPVAHADEGARYAPSSRGGRAAVADVIRERAEVRGANARVLVRVAECESGLDPYAVGDYGTSFGLFQLHVGGKLDEFYAMGYSTPFSVWQSADYAAWAFAQGDAPQWTCYRLLFGGWWRR